MCVILSGCERDAAASSPLTYVCVVLNVHICAGVCVRRYNPKLLFWCLALYFVYYDIYFANIPRHIEASVQKCNNVLWRIFFVLKALKCDGLLLSRTRWNIFWHEFIKNAQQFAVYSLLFTLHVISLIGLILSLNIFCSLQ